MPNKEKFKKILEKYGLPSIREGGLEYLVATNLMILEELKKLTKTKRAGVFVWNLVSQ